MSRFVLQYLCILCILFSLNSNALAYLNYRNTIPNGNRFGCAVCHIANQPPAGAPSFDLNPFGRDYRRIAFSAGNDQVPLWTRDLANLDSDNDGYTNGEELHEITGDIFVWQPVQLSSNVDDDWDLAAGVPSLTRNPGDGDLSVPQMRFDPIRPSEYSVNVGETVEVPFSGQATVPGRSLTAELVGSSKDLEGVRVTILTQIEEEGLQKITGSFTWTPAELQGGQHTIAIQLSDGTSSGVGTVRITVLGGIVVLPGDNQPPPYIPPVTIADFTVATFDFDRSLLVDIADFYLFASVYGQRATLSATRFDFNKSGHVDWPDFLFFAAFFSKRVNTDINYRTPARDQITFLPIEGGSFVQQINSLFQRVNILPHEMGKYEISNRQYNNFLQANNSVLEFTPWPFNSEAFATRVATLPDHPVIGVSWEMAEAYCKWAGGRLPLLKEWVFAARGLESRKYAHGDRLNNNQANFLSSSDPFEPGTTPIGYYNTRLHQGFQTADAYSLHGAYDMTGNVWEWCGDLRDDVTPNQAPIKGGSYLDSAFSNDMTLTAEQWLGITEKRENIGFRCTRDK
jgi:formylglycine-generating enzyme required for sulfatase activity